MPLLGFTGAGLGLILGALVHIVFKGPDLFFLLGPGMGLLSTGLALFWVFHAAFTGRLPGTARGKEFSYRHPRPDELLTVRESVRAGRFNGQVRRQPQLR